MDLLSHIQYMWNSICILHIHLYYLYNTHIIAIKFSLRELKIWQYIKTMRGSHRNIDCIKNPIPCIYMLLWMHSLTYKWELNFLYTDTTCIFFLSFSTWEANLAKISCQRSNVTYLELPFIFLLNQWFEMKINLTLSLLSS